METAIRNVGRVLATGCLLLVVGCNSAPHLRGTSATAPPPKVPAATPTALELVAYLNDNSRRIQSLECRALHLDAKQRLQSVGMTGVMVCQKPRCFRMSAKAFGTTQADLGSNEQEFWYWIGKAEPPYLFHCAHQDFAQGRARMPFPFQPDWIMEALGMAEYDPSRNFQLNVKPTTFELVENTVSPQGQRVRKVTVFSRAQQTVQVTAHLLQTADGREICSAHITEVQHDRASGAAIPRKVKLSWPSEHMSLAMTLDELVVNAPIAGDRHARLFTRPTLKDVQSYNLAQGFATPTGQLRRVGQW